MSTWDKDRARPPAARVGDVLRPWFTMVGFGPSAAFLVALPAIPLIGAVCCNVHQKAAVHTALNMVWFVPPCVCPVISGRAAAPSTISAALLRPLHAVWTAAAVMANTVSPSARLGLPILSHHKPTTVRLRTAICTNPVPRPTPQIPYPSCCPSLPAFATRRHLP